MSAAPYVLAGLGVVAAAVWVTARVVLRRQGDSDAYQRSTVARMNAASWRRHGNVVYLAADGYSYAATRPTKPGGGGTDEALLGLVSEPLAGGKGLSVPPAGSPTTAGGTNPHNQETRT